MEVKVTKTIAYIRDDQIVRIARYNHQQFFIYNHRGKYVAVFDEMNDVVNHVDEELIGSPPLLKLELEDYQDFDERNRQSEMNKDIINYIKSEVKSGGLDDLIL